MEPMQTQTTAVAVKSESSFFERNKKGILLLIGLLLIILGLIAFILYSNRTPMPNAITNPAPAPIIEESPQPIVSTPNTQTNIEGDDSVYTLVGPNFNSVPTTYTIKIPTNLITKTKATDKSYPGTFLLVADGYNLSVSVHSEGAITYNSTYFAVGNNSIFGQLYRSEDTQMGITSYGNVLGNNCAQGVEGDCGTYTASTALKADSLDAYFDVKVTTTASASIFNDIDTILRSIQIIKTN